MEARQGVAENGQVERVLARLGTRCIVLVGMMGAGKTSIGRRLASALHLPFIDADAEIVMFSPQDEHSHVIKHMINKVSGSVS